MKKIFQEYIKQAADTNIYHYTSPAGLAGILNNKCLRFTDRNYLNDYSKGIYILELCIKVAKELFPQDVKLRDAFVNRYNDRIKNPHSDNDFIYQCSFSLEQDCLCMWNYYTKGDSIRGYNLKFNSGQLCSMLNLHSTYEDGTLPFTYAGLVEYKESKQIKILKSVTNHYYTKLKENDSNISNIKEMVSFLVRKLIFLGIFFKMDCFNVEKEYRIAISLFPDGKGNFEATKEKQGFFDKIGILYHMLILDFHPKRF